MIMPFLRLVIIYIIVILAVVLFFNRDKVMSMIGYGHGMEQGEHHGGSMGHDSDDHDNAAMATPIATGQEDTPAQAPVETTEETPPEYSTADTAAIVMPTATPAPATATPSDSTQDMEKRIAEARAAYWKGDLAAAETHYAALVKDSPDNADMHGEFGNLLYAQQRYSEAAAQYFSAGKQLVAEGKMNQAMPLIGVLQNIAPEKAATLRKLAGQ